MTVSSIPGFPYPPPTLKHSPVPSIPLSGLGRTTVGATPVTGQAPTQVAQGIAPTKTGVFA